ncbi:unnamed protein product [Rhizophagus irregularis]|nr:unnamed protein product [Rhizophagus irregularis]
MWKFSQHFSKTFPEKITQNKESKMSSTTSNIHLKGPARLKSKKLRSICPIHVIVYLQEVLEKDPEDTGL